MTSTQYEHKYDDRGAHANKVAIWGWFLQTKDRKRYLFLVRNASDIRVRVAGDGDESFAEWGCPERRRV